MPALRRRDWTPLLLTAAMIGLWLLLHALIGGSLWGPTLYNTYTRQALARLLPERYTILNGEDDLGIPGIRKVKRLMRPIGQIQMCEARKK